MKKQVVFLFLFIWFISCNSSINKPDKMLDQEVMTNILYDLTVLQAANVYLPNTLNDNDLKATTYIYKKYEIDSITYHQNHKYYASNPKKYKKMYQEIIARLEAEKMVIDKVQVPQK